jgi:hypothetical protein
MERVVSHAHPCGKAAIWLRTDQFRLDTHRSQIESFTPDQLRQLKAVLDTHQRELELDDEQRSDRTELVSEADAEQSSSKRKADAVDKESDETEPARMAPALREPLAPRQDLGVDNTFGRDAKAKAMSSIHTQLTVPVVLHKPGSNKSPAKRNTSSKVKILNPKTILTRFLQRLMPEENILLAARRSCLLFYKNNSETPVYHVSTFALDLDCHACFLETDGPIFFTAARPDHHRRPKRPRIARGRAMQQLQELCRQILATSRNGTVALLVRGKWRQVYLLRHRTCRWMQPSQAGRHQVRCSSRRETGGGFR